MNRKISVLLATIITVFLVFTYSCSDDFLNTQPNASASGDVMVSPQGVESTLIGAYSIIDGVGAHTTNNWNGAYAWHACVTNWVWGSVYSDNAYKGSSFGDQTPINPIERYEVLPSNGYVNGKWIANYDGVSRANDALRFLNKAGDKISADRAKKIEAEAKFLRAWYHFELQRVYEKIPYIKTEEEMDGTKPANVPNNSMVWDDIEADLQYAINNLPEDPPKGEVGRADMYAAKAVKARVHLFQKEWSDAKTLLQDIIDNSGTELVDHYNKNYQVNTNNNKESIFEVQASVNDGSTGSLNALWGFSLNFPHKGPAAKCCGFFQPSHTLVEKFQTNENGLPEFGSERDDLKSDMQVASKEKFVPTKQSLDPRLDWTVGRRGIPFLDWGIMKGRSWIRDYENGGTYLQKKFMHRKEFDGQLSTTTGWAQGVNSINYKAYRLAHILLWRAEVAAHNGNLNKARKLVNRVRSRAKDDKVMGYCSTYKFDGGDVKVNKDKPAANYNLQTYPADHDQFSSADKALQAIRLELSLEFALEGHRYFDLRRWGLADEVLNNYITEDTQAPGARSLLEGASYDKTRDDYMPIPQSQLDIQDTLKQDPDYQ